eukprot:1530840-Prymnesium_polylepis.1
MAPILGNHVPVRYLVTFLSYIYYSFRTVLSYAGRCEHARAQSICDRSPCAGARSVSTYQPTTAVGRLRAGAGRHLDATRSFDLDNDGACYRLADLAAVGSAAVAGVACDSISIMSLQLVLAIDSPPSPPPGLPPRSPSPPAPLA